MIEICNLKREKPKYVWDFKAERSTAVGNPYLLPKYSREESCNEYRYYFKQKMILKDGFSVYMYKLLATYTKYGKLRLFCWCAPKQCHAETIRDWLLQRYKQHKINSYGGNMPEIITKTKPKVRLIVAGGRKFNNYNLLKESALEAVDHIKEEHPDKDIVIVSGGAKGADSLAIQFAKEYNVLYEIYYPNWDKHGKKAGYLRNKEMADIPSEYLLAFWDNKSNGTKHMIDVANRQKLTVGVINYE